MRILLLTATCLLVGYQCAVHTCAGMVASPSSPLFARLPSPLLEDCRALAAGTVPTGCVVAGESLEQALDRD
jgi:hypothetical protein